MKKRYVTKCLILLILSVLVSGCTRERDKEIIVSSNVKNMVGHSENEIKKDINLGNKLFNMGKYDDAKNAYDMAINLDKMNKDTYLTIENKYEDKNKIKYAEDIIQEAIDNNVDVSNMKNILLRLDQKQELANQQIENSKKNQNSLQQNEIPSKSVRNQDDEAEDQAQSQSQQDQDNVEASKIFADIEDVYESNGKRYISVIPGEYFDQSQAAQEAAKDGVTINTDYYIRKIGGAEEFEVSNNATFIIYKFMMQYGSKDNSSESVSYEQFKSIVNDISGSNSDCFWVYLNKYNKVISLQAQILN